MHTQQIIWILVMIAFTAIELCTFNMITIWFVLGSLAALLASVAGAGMIAQLWIFVIVSVAALAVTKPLVSKKLRQKQISTNADRIIGMKGIVTEDIQPGKFAGKVKVNGQEWSAVAKDGGTIAEGSTVTVTQISGVKLIVDLV